MTGSIEKLEREKGIKAEWLSFPLHPEVPEEGIKLTDLFGRTRDEVISMTSGLRITAESLGIPFGRSEITFNTRLAQELTLWAKTKGKFHEFHNEAFKTGLGEGNNLGKIEVLLGIVERSGLDKDEAMEILEKGTFKEAVDNEWNEAAKLHITAVPTIIAGDERIVGAQPYDEIVRIVERGLKVSK